MSVTVEHHLKRVNYFLRAFSECKDDINSAKMGRVPHYNLDFGLLVPVLFDRRASGSKDFLSSLKGGMSKVLSNRPPSGHHDLVVSGATLVEFYDQLSLVVQDLEHRVPQTLRDYTNTSELEIIDLVRSSKQIRRIWSFLSKVELVDW
jgi:hypothetical protein